MKVLFLPHGASEEEGDESDFIIEVSGEWPAHKVVKDDGLDGYFPPPFLAHGMLVVGDEKERETAYERMAISHNADFYGDCFGNVNRLLWERKRDIAVKWIQKRKERFADFMAGFYNPDSVTSELDKEMMTHQYLHSFLCVLIEKETEKRILSVSKEWGMIRTSAMSSFLDYAGSSDLFADLRRSVHKCVTTFLKQLPMFLPALIMVSHMDSLDESAYGISTLDVDIAVSLYKDMCETFTKSYALFVALDNMKTQGNFESFENGKTGFEDVVGKIPNREKREWLRSHSHDLFPIPLSEIICDVMRNAEAHDGVSVDGLSQVITFEDAHGGRTRMEKESFVRFAHRCIKGFNDILVVWENLYSVTKLTLIRNGETLHLRF